MVIEEEIKEISIENKNLTKPIKHTHLKKFKIFFITLILVLILIALIFFISAFCKEWNFNQEIIKNNSPKIELSNVKELNLWNMSIENIKNTEKYIEINYNDYKIKLNSEKLSLKNLLKIDIAKKENTYKEFDNESIVEIDVSKVEPYNLIEELEFNTSNLLNNLSRIDIYGINSQNQNIEYIETIEIYENSITIVFNENFKKYLLVYIPVKEIKVDSEEITLFKNETHQMQIEISPDNATSKNIHIDDLSEDSIIQITENGTIQALKVGDTEFELQAENGNVKKKIKVTIKSKAEGIEISSEQMQLTEGESKQIEAKVIPEDVENKQLSYESSNPEIVKVSADGQIEAIKEGSSTISVTTTAEPVQQRQIKVVVKAKPQTITPSIQIQNTNTQSNSTNESLANNYINGILVINKNHPLPSNYAPGTNQEALQSFNNMKNRAQQEGISLKIVSGYRSYQTQAAIYKRNVQLYGETIANTFSAKPGQSEHQSGLAFDINNTKSSFKNTIEGKWLAEHCYDYGFIIRYPENKQSKTGYIYEPWHIRYVGTDISLSIKNTGLCLEEYLGI